MFTKLPSLCLHKVNLCSRRDNLYSSKANPWSNKVSSGNKNPYTHIDRVNLCKAKVKSYSSKLKILMAKGRRCKILMCKGNRFKTSMSRGSRCKIRMSKDNRLNNLLTHMLLISSLWQGSIKATQVKILPTGKVTYSGGNIKCHMDKTLHYGDKILTNKDGFYSSACSEAPNAF